MRRLVVAIVLLVGAGVALPLLGERLFGWGRDPARVSAPHRRVEIDEGRALNVLEIGEGPAVVLVHGLPGNLQDWGEVPEKLAAMGNRVIVYDRIGYGSSSRDEAAPGEYTYASSASDLVALLDALAVQRAALAGWSYGGAVVQVAAALRPERVSHVALIGAVGPALADVDPDALSLLLRSGLGEPVLRWVNAVPFVGRAFIAANLDAAFTRATDVPDGFTDRTRAMLALPGTLAAFVAEEQRGDPASLRPEQVRVPALVLHGTEDLLVPLAVGEDLARRIPSAKLLRLPGGSHMLPVTDPDLVAGALHALAAQPPETAATSGAQPGGGSHRDP